MNIGLIKGLLKFILVVFLYVLVTVFMPVFMLIVCKKKKIKFRMFWDNFSNVYISVISNIFPVVFYVLPTFYMVKCKASTENVIESEPNIDLSKLKIGDVILTGKESWSYSQLIQTSNILSSSESNRYWTHACIYAGNGKVIESQSGGQGVIETDIKEFYVKGKYKLMVLRPKYADDVILNDIISFCTEKKDKNTNYDLWGVSFYVLAAMIPPMFSGWLDGDFAECLFNVKDAYFCSELIAEAYEVSGIKAFSVPAWRVKPLDFALNPFFEKIFIL